VLDVAGATVLGLGDSIAAGYGIGWAGGYDEATATGDNASAYPNVLAKELDGTADRADHGVPQPQPVDTPVFAAAPVGAPSAPPVSDAVAEADGPADDAQA